MATSFDQRVVRYGSIHDVQPQHWKWFVEASCPEDGDVVLDCGCGYGECTKELLKQSPGKAFFVDLVDESPVQLERARRELLHEYAAGPSRLAFHLGRVADAAVPWRPPNDRKYDKIFLKMVLHEVGPEPAGRIAVAANDAGGVPAEQSEQVRFLNELYGMLKPGGILVVWDVAVADQAAPFFREVIRQKDDLLGFQTLKERRYVMTPGDLEVRSRASLFGKSEMVRLFHCKFFTGRRLDEEFAGRADVYRAWVERIDDLYARYGQRANTAIQFRRYSAEHAAPGEPPDADDAGPHRWFIVDRAIWRLRRPDLLDLATIECDHAFDHHLTPSPRREGQAEHLHQVIQHRLEKLAGCELLRRHGGLMRVTTYEISHDGVRQFSKDGLDYFYHHGTASEDVEKFMRDIARAYFHHVAVVYTTDSGRVWPALTHFLRRQAEKSSSSSWLRVVLDTGEQVLHVTLCVGGDSFKTVDVPVSGFSFGPPQTLHDQDIGKLRLNGTQKCLRLGLGHKSFDQAALDFLRDKPPGWPVVPEGSRFVDGIGGLEQESLLEFAQFLQDSGLKYGCYFMPPASMVTGGSRSEDVAVFFSSREPLTSAEEGQLFAFLAKMWSDLRGVELLAASASFLNTAYRETLLSHSDERKFFVQHVLFPLILYGHSSIDPSALIAAYSDAFAKDHVSTFNAWATSIRRTLDRADIDVLAGYVRNPVKGLSTRNRSKLEAIRHECKEFIKYKKRELLTEARIGAAALGAIGQYAYEQLQAAESSSNMDEMTECCKRAMTFITSLERGLRDTIKDFCERFWNGALPRTFQADACPTDFRFDVSGMQDAVGALRVNAIRHSHEYALNYKETANWCQLTWLETLGPRWDYASLSRSVQESVTDRGIHRGLPQVILFGLENNANSIEVRFGRTWSRIWPPASDSRTESGAAAADQSTTDKELYGVRYTFRDQ
ncbi:MAG TPA: class I SAM-dependent methyltransferase [Tepidisphaeraceae bacterium]|nr:class I SAM-dependent methyltransferase [Tepidisphaeraceae bacterium]